MENHRLRTEILDLREHLQEYQDQDRIFRETLLNAQRTKEEILDKVNREKALILQGGRLQGRRADAGPMAKSGEMEAQIRRVGEAAEAAALAAFCTTRQAGSWKKPL